MHIQCSQDAYSGKYVTVNIKFHDMSTPILMQARSQREQIFRQNQLLIKNIEYIAEMVRVGDQTILGNLLKPQLCGDVVTYVMGFVVISFPLI